MPEHSKSKADEGGEAGTCCIIIPIIYSHHKVVFQKKYCLLLAERLIIMREVSYRGEAIGRVPVWHWAHDNSAYHTDEKDASIQ